MMSAALLQPVFPPDYFSQHLSQQVPEPPPSRRPYPLSPPYPSPLAPNDHQIYLHAAALLDSSADARCMNPEPTPARPNIRVHSSTPTPLPPDCDGRQDSLVSVPTPAAPGWEQYNHLMSMGGPSAASRRPLKRARAHQRTPSTSTIASNGPASPYTANTSYPQIANVEYGPNSPAPYADQTPLFSKTLPDPRHTPVDGAFLNGQYMVDRVAHVPGAHLAMKDFAIQHHLEDFPPEFYQSSRHSMSSYGNDSPATPQSGAGDNADVRNLNIPQNDYRQPNPNVQLYRTESQAYQDELYNPSAVDYSAVSSAAKRLPTYLSPHRNLISERLQTANLARSGSPASAMSRERSPFRDGSPLAPAGNWNSGQAIGTAAGMRQQQKQETEQAEYAQHGPQLQREATKTISPKDAVLDYNETDQPPLFQDSLPSGYKMHTGGTENWSNNFVSQPGSTFGNMVTRGMPNQHQHVAAFGASADGFAAVQQGYPFVGLPQASHQGHTPQVHNAAYHPTSYPTAKMSYSEPTPEFPAHITRMESSVSEAGPVPSSQDSMNVTATPQRPADTRANTGTYTCTYHGCTQRFDSHANLQKHKRDFHRSQQQQQQPKEGTSTSGSSTSPRSSESPAPDEEDMDAAAILARNSQAGPHKCTRTNPSTGKPCNQIFSRPYDLTRHEDTIHNNRKQKVRCQYCREEKTFSRNDALTRHMRVVHPEVEVYGKRGRRGD